MNLTAGQWSQGLLKGSIAAVKFLTYTGTAAVTICSGHGAAEDWQDGHR